MTNRHQLLTDYQSNAGQALQVLKAQGFDFLTENLIWQILVYEFEHFDVPSEVLFHKFSINEIVDKIQKYFYENGVPIGNIELETSIIPEDINDDLIKAEIKYDGEIWEIHKTDKDTFPSDPHAHNYDRNYKLHLGTGELFRKKKKIGNIRKKDFINLRQIISAKVEWIKLPVLQSNNLII